MHNVTIKTLLVVTALAACSVATAGGRGNPTAPPPTIVKAAIITKENVLVITGRHFGTTPPTVTLADQVLDVQRFSEHEIVASLPHRLAAATYGVTVTTNGRNRTSSNLFSVALAGAARK